MYLRQHRQILQRVWVISHTMQRVRHKCADQTHKKSHCKGCWQEITVQHRFKSAAQNAAKNMRKFQSSISFALSQLYKTQKSRSFKHYNPDWQGATLKLAPQDDSLFNIMGMLKNQSSIRFQLAVQYAAKDVKDCWLNAKSQMSPTKKATMNTAEKCLTAWDSFPMLQ